MKRVQNLNLESLDINKSYVEIDGIGWRNSSHISIKGIMDFMQLDIDKETNVRLVAFTNQDVSVNDNPNPIANNLQLSMDENFLYVWVKDRWKRVPLSEF